MTKDRARYVLQNENFCGKLPFAFENEFTAKSNRPLSQQGITQEEDKYIRLVWSMMGSHTSYYDALKAIAEVP